MADKTNQYVAAPEAATTAVPMAQQPYGTVVTAQYLHAPPGVTVQYLHAPPGLGDLFGCFEDMDTCCCGTFCAPCLIGQTHRRAGIDAHCTVPIMYTAGAAAIWTWEWQCLTAMAAAAAGSLEVAASTAVPPVGLLYLGQALTCGALCVSCARRNDVARAVGAGAQDSFGNFCTWLWCPACAACQEARAVNKAYCANGYRPLVARPDMLR